MKVRYDFEVDGRGSESLDPRDFADCDDIEILESVLIEQANPGLRVFVNKDDLHAMWESIAGAERPPRSCRIRRSSSVTIERLSGSGWTP